MSATPHPTLRAWTESDFPAFVLLHSDPHVVEWLGGAHMDTDAMRAAFDRTRRHIDDHGWGIWAITDEQGFIVGAAGLQPVREGMPCYPGVEVAWRLAFAAQGKGRVTTAMRAVLPWAFAHIPDLQEIVAYTGRTNMKSRKVMERLGFVADAARDFEHPGLREEHPLRKHAFYVMKRPSA